MHVLFIIALALALSAGFATVRPGHAAGAPPTMTTFDGGGNGSGDGSGSGGSINGSGPPG
jgi:Spy/CpxP family protein refolding chaperone